LTDFEGAYAANPKINAVVTPNDENAAPIISHLQAAGLKPQTIPFTGQDATLVGIQKSSLVTVRYGLQAVVARGSGDCSLGDLPACAREATSGLVNNTPRTLERRLPRSSTSVGSVVT